MLVNGNMATMLTNRDVFPANFLLHCLMVCVVSNHQCRHESTYDFLFHLPLYIH